MSTKRKKPTSPPSTAADAARATRRTSGKPAGPPAAPGYVEIASRAYAIFLERGAAHGFDQEDWVQAERELLATQS